MGNHTNSMIKITLYVPYTNYTCCEQNLNKYIEVKR